MRFFSKLTFICNCCFLAYVVLWYFEVHSHQRGHEGQVIQLPWLESSLVILGYLAIIVNVFFLLICLIFTSLKVKLKVPGWIIIFNGILLCGQVYFHFFFK